MTGTLLTAIAAAARSHDALVAGTSIHATAGKATGSDASAKVTATKNGDITTVRIGAVEICCIPDALVFGG